MLTLNVLLIIPLCFPALIVGLVSSKCISHLHPHAHTPTQTGVSKQVGLLCRMTGCPQEGAHLYFQVQVIKCYISFVKTVWGCDNYDRYSGERFLIKSQNHTFNIISGSFFMMFFPPRCSNNNKIRRWTIALWSLYIMKCSLIKNKYTKNTEKQHPVTVCTFRPQLCCGGRLHQFSGNPSLRVFTLSHLASTSI